MASDVPNSEHSCVVPETAITYIDPNVLSHLPKNTSTTQICSHGQSHWTRTARIDITNDQGLSSFFLKTSSGPQAEQMVSSEYTAMTTIASITPSFVPKPLGFGQYASDPTIFFFLSEFRDMSATLSDPETFAQRLAQMHQRGTSPNGKFGFHVPTFHGTTPIEHPWCDRWQTYFSITTRRLLELEQKQRGKDAELGALIEPFFDFVVPRLLGPLESGGRAIKPCLIHGDLWNGNVGTDSATGKPLIFDAGSFYAHHEYELGVWRQSWNTLGQTVGIERYLKYFPRSAPEEDFEARNELYAVRIDILDSILYKDEVGYRESMLRGMKSLVARFGSQVD